VRLGRVGFDRVAGQLADLHAVLADRADLVEAGSRLTIEQLPWHPLSDLKDADEVQRATLWVGAQIRDDRK
jgi:hypothetical protein